MKNCIFEVRVSNVLEVRRKKGCLSYTKEKHKRVRERESKKILENKCEVIMGPLSTQATLGNSTLDYKKQLPWNKSLRKTLQSSVILPKHDDERR